MLHLLKTKRFLPLFTCQFLGALNDNIFKNALVILITYHLAEKLGLDTKLFVTLAAGIFIFPFFLFSATAGGIADKLEKSQLIRIIKFIEIILMSFAAIGFYLEDIWILMVTLFLMGSQSAFFGPLKYSILPDHLKTKELIGGNALVETATFLAILLGTIIGGLLILQNDGILIISTLVIFTALVGFISSSFIPSAGPASPNLKVNYNVFTETWRIVSYAKENKEVFIAIIGISWFWLVGATFLAQFPTYAKYILNAKEDVVILFLTLFSVGIGTGSIICNKLTKGQITSKYVPLGALGMAIFSIILYGISILEIENRPAELIGVIEYLSISHYNILISMCLFMIAVSGGIYIVPLYTIIQSRSKESHRARVIASNNVMNAFFMVISAIATLAMFHFKFTVIDVFLTVGILNIPVAWLIKTKLS